MIQHVEGHAIHGTHQITDHRTEKTIDVTSTHHQMMIEGKGGYVIATASIVVEYDVEVVIYDHAKALCFQPHPEFPNYPECTDYYFSLLSDYLGIK